MKYLLTISLITLNASAMAKEIKTEILIHATPEKVWSILINFDDYPNWNPFIKSIKGEVKAGNNITARIEPPEAKGMTFKPKVLTYETNKELKWLGRLLFSGLFDGEHTFELIDNGNGTTLLDKVNYLKVFLFHYSGNNSTITRKKDLSK